MFDLCYPDFRVFFWKVQQNLWKVISINFVGLSRDFVGLSRDFVGLSRIWFWDEVISRIWFWINEAISRHWFWDEAISRHWFWDEFRGKTTPGVACCCVSSCNCLIVAIPKFGYVSEAANDVYQLQVFDC